MDTQRSPLSAAVRAEIDRMVQAWQETGSNRLTTCFQAALACYRADHPEIDVREAVSRVTDLLALAGNRVPPGFWTTNHLLGFGETVHGAGR